MVGGLARAEAHLLPPRLARYHGLPRHAIGVGGRGGGRRAAEAREAQQTRGLGQGEAESRRDRLSVAHGRPETRKRRKNERLVSRVKGQGRVFRVFATPVGRQRGQIGCRGKRVRSLVSKSSGGHIPAIVTVETTVVLEAKAAEEMSKGVHLVEVSCLVRGGV